MTKLQPLEPYNLFTSDPVLVRAVAREGAVNSQDDLVSFGERTGSVSVSTRSDITRVITD